MRQAQRFVPKAHQLQRLGAESAENLRAGLTHALATTAKQIIVLTHGPPFREARWHEGQISGDGWLPWFACRATGEVLRAAMEQHPDKRILGFCGHTHGAGEPEILPNQRVLTGGAEYGRPRVQGVLEVCLASRPEACRFLSGLLPLLTLMDLPPPLPSRARRFYGWWRVALSVVVLSAIISATQNDALLECTLGPLIARGFNTMVHFPPPRGRLAIGLAIVKMFVILAPLLAVLFYGVAGGLISLYVACRWRPTPRTAWLTAYALCWTGLSMCLGLGLRYRFGEQMAVEKGHPLQVYMLLWPLSFLVLSGCYAALFRRDRPPLPATKVKRSLRGRRYLPACFAPAVKTRNVPPE